MNNDYISGSELEGKWREAMHEFATVCGIDLERKYRRDCYYFSEITDMGAHTPYCGKEKVLEIFNCIGCNKFCDKNDVAPVTHAAWLNEKDYHKCSNCGAILEEEFYWRYYGYCYHCGAKMDGEENV